MQSLILLALLGVVCVFASSDSGKSSSSSTTTDTTSSSDESSGFLRAALVDRAKNPTVKLGFLESDHHDDDDDSLSGSEDDYVRRKARDERRIKAAIQAAAAVKKVLKRETYQAKFTRDNAALCVFNANFPRNGTQCTQRQNGPVFFIAKTSSPLVTADSFDGNKDGKDDVQGAYENLFNGAGGTQFETLINAFLQQVRNRALVNGGSIKLSALILTGRKSNGQFATFGPNGDLLFSPCFPVIQDANYNIDLYGITQGLNTLFRLHLTYTDFVTPGADPINIADDIFKERVPDAPAKRALIAENFVNPDPTKLNADNTRQIVTGLKVGDVIFEKCTQYSYFQ